MDASQAPFSSAAAAPRRPAGQAGLLDLVRGLAISIVLYGHALEMLFLRRPDGGFDGFAFAQYQMMASFTMALFFFVSGAAAPRIHEKGFRTVAKTSLFILVLAYLVHLLGLAVMLVGMPLKGEWNYLEFGLHALRSSVTGKDFSTVVVWFLVSLAIVRVLAFAVFAHGGWRRAWLILPLVALATLAMPLMPMHLQSKTWFAGLFFFGLGMAFARRRLAVPAWLWLPLGIVVTVLARLNDGCAWTPLTACGDADLRGQSAVWLHVGLVGFIPLFLLTAVLGCVTALSFGRMLAATRVAPILKRMGRRSLDLLVLNGFVLVFLQPWLQPLAPSPMPILAFPVILVVVIGCHLALLTMLDRPLAALQKAASRLADLGMRRVERVRRPRAVVVTPS